MLGFIPLENLDQETKSVKRKTKNETMLLYRVCMSALHAVMFEWLSRALLTYLVASFVGFLHQHPPLVIQLHGHAAAAVGMFAHPAKELLQLPSQGGVGVGVRLGVAGARHQTLCSEKIHIGFVSESGLGAGFFFCSSYF